MVFQLDLFRSDESSLSFVHIQLQNSKYYLRNFPHTLFARHSWNRKSRYSILHLLTQTSGCKKLSDKTRIISNFHVFEKLGHKAGKVSNKSFFSRWQDILCLNSLEWKTTLNMVYGRWFVQGLTCKNISIFPSFNQEKYCVRCWQEVKMEHLIKTHRGNFKMVSRHTSFDVLLDCPSPFRTSRLSLGSV